jgi:hypothetical protein
MPSDGGVGPHGDKSVVSGSERESPRPVERERDSLTALALALAALAVIAAVAYIAGHTRQDDRSAIFVPPPAWRELFR